MTLSSTANKISYTGNGAQVAFSFPYLFYANADLYVYVITDDVPALMTLGSDYSVSGAGGSSGVVTFTTAPANGTTVRIFRWVAMTQATDYVENDPLAAETIETNLDRLTMMVQQVADRIGGSAFSIGYSEILSISATDLDAWDAGGHRVANVGTPVDDTDAATKGYVDALTMAAGNVVAPLSSESGYALIAGADGTWSWMALPNGGAMLPMPTAADANKFVVVDGAGEEFQLIAAAAARTLLALGTAALLNVGTGANQIVQLDGDGKLPALDASALTGIDTGLTLTQIKLGSYVGDATVTQHVTVGFKPDFIMIMVAPSTGGGIRTPVLGISADGDYVRSFYGNSYAAAISYSADGPSAYFIPTASFLINTGVTFYYLAMKF